ncbi:MAG: hypothetical protein V2I24_17025 [Halieaceae bacterium]|jgi:hypothetical protein|nr:hypothetical protein [Halieaceae bacterium]
MSDELSYSISYGAGAPVSRAATTPSAGGDPIPAELLTPDAPLVAFATCELIPVNEQMTLAINRENGAQRLLIPSLVEALKTCTQFNTVAGHTRTLCRTRSDLRGREQMVASTLEELRKAGFFLEADTISGRLNAPAARQRAATRVFVITCDRPDDVERLLESMLESGGLTEHDRLYLIDDSRDALNQEKNAEAVARFCTRSARAMSYFGAQEQQRLLDRLVDALPGHEHGIRFLIDREQWGSHPTYGRSRTLALLLSVGYRAIVLDDDILCRAIRPAVPEEGISVGVDQAREASFFADRDSLMAHAVPLAASPLTLHAQAVGATLGEVIRGLNGGELQPSQLVGANAAMTNIWRADSPVLITQSGSWGDPGTGNAHWTLNLSEFSISRLLAAPQGVTAAIENRCAWLGSPRPTIVKMAFMSQMTGLDNSALLPPYFPAFRGEDLLFASMVEAMHPRGAVLEHGFAVPHLPGQRPRKTLRDPIASAGGIGLFSAYLTNRIDYTDANNAEDRLTMLAQDFRRLADKSTADLLMDYRREVARGHAMSLHLLSEQRRRTQDMNSANWTGYLDRGISEMQSALQREWSPTDLEDVPQGTSAEQAAEGFRGFLRGYAAALEGWVAIRDIAAAHDVP